MSKTVPFLKEGDLQSTETDKRMLTVCMARSHINTECSESADARLLVASGRSMVGVKGSFLHELMSRILNE